MDSTIGAVNAFHRLRLQRFLPASNGPCGGWVTPAPTPPSDVAPPRDAPETQPMLYRSEAFAEDLAGLILP